MIIYYIVTIIISVMLYFVVVPLHFNNGVIVVSTSKFSQSKCEYVVLRTCIIDEPGKYHLLLGLVEPNNNNKKKEK